MPMRTMAPVDIRVHGSARALNRIKTYVLHEGAAYKI